MEETPSPYRHRLKRYWDKYPIKVNENGYLLDVNYPPLKTMRGADDYEFFASWRYRIFGIVGKSK